MRYLFFIILLFLSFWSAIPTYCSATEQACSSPHLKTLSEHLRYGLPPSLEKEFIFADSVIPIQRADVRSRVLKEINYLLQDRRSKVLAWLSKADAHKNIIVPILKQYDLPQEFIFLAAIESSYNSRSLSSAGAYGFWQFIKSTAVCGPQGCDRYDWKMNVNNWKDERADLVISTHAAARYLAWLNRIKRVELPDSPPKDGFNDWVLTAASYNAGPKRVQQQMTNFKTTSYWDTPLPTETEKYVPRWMAVWLIHKYRDFYGIKTAPQKNVVFETIEKIRLEKDLSFAAMAKLLNLTPREVWSLNSQIPPEKGFFPAKNGKSFIQHAMNVPRGTKTTFLAQLAANGYTKKK